MDPITWAIIIGSALAGAAVGYFWDEIKEWATRMLGYILDALNKMFEEALKATVFLVKSGTRFYKKLEVIVRNTATGKYFSRYKEEEISEYELEEKLRSQISANPNLPVYEYRIN
jgi:phosphoribosylaminoimidazole-succinocarboxamide synthase